MGAAPLGAAADLALAVRQRPLAPAQVAALRRPGLVLHVPDDAPCLAEREIGQRLVVDLRMDVGESDATLTDRVEDTVDYAEVCQVVALVAQQRSYRTLERLCAAIADRLLEQFGLESVWVKAAKPEPPIPLPVEEVSVEVWREPEE